MLLSLTLQMSAMQQPPLLLLATARHDLSGKSRTGKGSGFHRQTPICCCSSKVALSGRMLRCFWKMRELWVIFPGWRSLWVHASLVLLRKRQVEGGHTRVHLRSLGGRHRAEANDSLALRMSELEYASMQRLATAPFFQTCLMPVKLPEVLECFCMPWGLKSILLFRTPDTHGIACTGRLVCGSGSERRNTSSEICTPLSSEHTTIPPFCLKLPETSGLKGNKR